MDENTKQSNINPAPAQGIIPKYSAVLRFWNTPQEIEVVDYVGTINALTHQGHIVFIDTTGRLWRVPEQDVIIIKNFPDKEDIEDFQRLKKEADEMNKKMEKQKKPIYNEVG